MDNKKLQQLSRRKNFLKLSLKKNHLISENDASKRNSSDVIVLDDSFDRLRSDYSKKMQSPVVYSPIVINDSCESLTSNVEHCDMRPPDKDSFKNAYVSINSSKEESTLSNIHNEQPSNEGWSPVQNIICVTPRIKPTPSTPKDIANESLEECSLKKIQLSQKKILDDLYGHSWKSIPSLFKRISHNHDNLDLVSKQLQFNDDESDKENIRHDLQRNKLLYLTGSDAKNKFQCVTDTEKKSKKKLYTEKVVNTPEPKSVKVRNFNSTTKKLKTKSVTELVEIMRKDIDELTKKVGNVMVTPSDDTTAKRLSFMASLADNVPSWRCNIEAIQYHDNFKNLKEKLARRLFEEFNRVIFENAMDADMPITWDTKLRSTAGTTTNRLVKTSSGEKIRTSSIKLSSKVVDAPQRLRDTLAHELCHAATWLLDAELRAGHGPLWKKWATKTLRAFPELGEISRCHDMEIHFKYCYKCTKCGYSIKRHSKSIDVTKKCCGYCRGTFEVIVNRKNKDGVIISTPARKGGANDFALYVKEHYSTFKDGTRNHAQVMKILGEQFSARKNKPS